MKYLIILIAGLAIVAGLISWVCRATWSTSRTFSAADRAALKAVAEAGLVLSVLTLVLCTAWAVTHG